jgi:hypothetical protein
MSTSPAGRCQARLLLTEMDVRAKQAKDNAVRGAAAAMAHVYGVSRGSGSKGTRC